MLPAMSPRLELLMPTSLQRSNTIVLMSFSDMGPVEKKKERNNEKREILNKFWVDLRQKSQPTGKISISTTVKALTSAQTLYNHPSEKDHRLGRLSTRLQLRFQVTKSVKNDCFEWSVR